MTAFLYRGSCRQPVVASELNKGNETFIGVTGMSLVGRHEQEWTNQVAYMSVLLWQCHLASVLMDYVNAGKLYSAQLFRSAVDCRPIYTVWKD